MTDDKEEKRKFYWHANTSSGGTLSLLMDFPGALTKEEKEGALAQSIAACYEHMKHNGFIPFDAKIMSSGDLALAYGKSRQYWEKLLNEGKIHYKETSAGRITTNLWVQGYLNDKENVNKYVKDVKTVLDTIDRSKKRSGSVQCPACNENRFEFHVNMNDNINGLCRACRFHVHTTK